MLETTRSDVWIRGRRPSMVGRCAARMPTAMKRAAFVIIAFTLTASAGAQLIPVRTAPIATGNQFDFFPSATRAAGSVSLAIADSLHEPFENPATAARVARGYYFGAPNIYSLAGNAGSGATLPIGVLRRRGSIFAAIGAAVQEVGGTNVATPNVPVQVNSGPSFGGSSTTADQTNRYAFALLGSRLRDSTLSIGASAAWSQLHALDGADVLYANSLGLSQHGDALDLRLGFMKAWTDGRRLQALLLRNAFDMTHNVQFEDVAWDPASRSTVASARSEQNSERRETWGASIAIMQPLPDSAWHVGATVIANRITHPRAPINGPMDLAGDPAQSSAFDLGLGIARATAKNVIGVDAIYEPIWSQGLDATDAADRARFSNVLVRMGFTHSWSDLGSNLVWQLHAGVAGRAVSYRLASPDSGPAGFERWTEWTPTWGVTYGTPSFALHVTWELITGLGRPGAAIQSGGIPLGTFGPFGGFGPPSALAVIRPVTVSSVQFSLSVPIP
jgi:hypothetical protein